MADSTPAPPRKTVPHERNRGRKILLGMALCTVITITALFAYSRSTPAEAFKFLHFGTDIFKAKLQSTPPFQGQPHINLLLLGADDDQHTDTMKLVSVDFTRSDVSVLSIPRDTWVAIPGHGYSRVNAAYTWGGKGEAKRIALAQTVVATLLADLSGQPVRIDHYICVHTDGLDRVIDAMGGIDITVEKQMDYDDKADQLFIHLRPGLQHLNGSQAEGYVRFRHDAEGDYGRIRRQDRFLQALVAKLGAPNERARLPRLIGPMMQMVSTDISGADFLALADLTHKVGMNGIRMAVLPTVPTHKSAAAVLEVRDTAKAALVINEVLNGPR